ENIIVTDDNGTPGDPTDDFPVECFESDGAMAAPFTLQSGESNEDIGLTCLATGIASEGQYANLATVEGVSVGPGEVVTDTDPSHYVGALPSIAVLKSNDADEDDEFNDS